MKSKKILSCALAVMLSLGTLTVLPEKFNSKIGMSITAEAASSDLLIKTDSEGLKYVDSYKGNGGDVVIPKDISYINESAFEGVTSITSVTAKGDLYVMKSGFQGCTKIRRLVVEGDAFFSQGAFAYCVNLEAVEIKGSIDEIIGGDAFAFCTKLRNFKVKGSTYDYEIGEEAFLDCINLTSVDITENCTKIHNEAFLNCFRLNSLTIPEKTKFYTAKGTKHVGYSLGYSSEEDCFDNKIAYFNNNTPTSIYLYYFVYEVSSGRYWDTDYYGLFGRLERFTPCKITLNVYKGSNAETFAKKNNIAYKCIIEEADDQLASPDNIKASAKTKNSITLTWNKVKGADAYTVYIYKSSTGKYEEYKTVKSNTCVIKNLKKNTKYKFKVVALDKVNGKYKKGEVSDPVAITTKK